MSNKELPFYTQAALLDKYIQDIDPLRDKDIIEVIVDVLKTRKDLRQYFFRNRPSPNWASILWENNFFDTHPSPEESEEGLISLPFWDIQGFLYDIADLVPEIVLKHIQSIEGNAYYISHAIGAVCRLSPSKAISAKERIIKWLNDPNIAGGILDKVYDYISVLISEEFIDDAISVFDELSKPRKYSDFGTVGTRSATSGPVVTLFDNAIGIDYHEVNVLVELIRSKPEKISRLLQDHLGDAIQIEASINQNQDWEKTSFWRVAVEETGQDLGDSAKEKILKRFIKALECWAKIEINTFKVYILELLGDDRNIFYRVGLYFLQKLPSEFPNEVEKELKEYENLDKTEIKHEFFLLLRAGFPILSSESKKELLKTILSGLPSTRKELYTKNYDDWIGESELTLSEFLHIQDRLWIRDRLWMIRDNLVGETKVFLNNLIEEHGQPEHPTFHSWMSGAGWIKRVSPISADDLMKLSPDKMLDLARNWKPEINQHDIFKEESYQSFGKELSKIIYYNTTQYEDLIFEIATIRPDYASEIILFFCEDDNKVSQSQWEIVLRVCQKLLKNEEIKLGDDWIWTRQCMTKLISTGFTNETHSISKRLLFLTRDILFLLMDDPDPILGSESIPEVGKTDFLNDPLTFSLNHVRPSALRTFIQYAIYRANKTKPKIRLEGSAKEKLLERLDKSKESSYSIHSVFGQYIPHLYWLDPKWAQEIIHKILPQEIQEESLWYFQSSWDAYVTNKYDLNVKNLIAPFYPTAIDNYSRGFVTRQDITNNFAIHLVFDFLFNDYGSDFIPDQKIPLIYFYKTVKADDADIISWACWRIGSTHTTELGEWWLKLRSLWEWRVQEAISSNNSNDYDKDIRNFACFLDFAPESETIVTLYPLLEGMLSHVTNIRYRDKGWDAIEKYLSLQVDRNPLECIQLYHRMREERGEYFVWHRETDHAKKILEAAAENQKSRKLALSTIDNLMSKGNYAFQYIYERYSK